MEVYGTGTLGIGGVIRESVDDFIVEEVLVDGSVARIEAAGSRGLGASTSRQRYLLCIMVKRNWDMLVAIKNIAKQLGVSQTQIQVAGIKDAKAVTAQYITIENGTAEDIARINVKDIEVRPIGYFRDELSSFYLLGNSFKIRIKALKHSEATVEKRLSETMEKLESFGGIPNFFGHQRFGTSRPITHIVGKAILNGDFEEAAMLFLAEPSEHEHASSRQTRVELQAKRDFGQALHNYPKQLRFERLMLRHLVEKTGDFVGAFRRLPIKLQQLFVQAYQSYLFNRFLSERIRNGFSLNSAEVGDFVVNVERSGLPMAKTGRMVNADSLAEVSGLIKAGKLRVALPLVGTRQRLSEGVMGQIEKRILEAEGVEPANFNVDAMPEISGKGGLRAIVSPVRDFLVESGSPSTNGLRRRQAELGFTLLRGSYATMLLREIMKPPDPICAGF